MVRRQKGEGSITNLGNGKYRVRIEVEPTGTKRKWVSRTVSSKTEAIKVLRQLQREKEDGKTSTGLPEVLFEALVEPFITYKENEGVRLTTKRLYKRSLDYLKKYLGNSPVTTIQTETINDVILEMRKDNVSSSTTKIYMSVLHNFFQWLIYTKKLLSYNPVQGHIKIKTVKAKRKLEVLSQQEHKEISRILKAHYEDFLAGRKRMLLNKFYPIYLLMYETGIRRGELLGLTWRDIDFTKKVVFINKCAVYIEGLQIGAPKTEAGNRHIFLSEGTLGVLRSLKEAEGASEDDCVFHNMRDTKRPVAEPSFNTVFKVALREAGITRRLTLHDIRHTNASLMIAKGVDAAVITERLGHSSINVTYGVYAHVIKDSKNATSAVVSAL